MSRRNSFVLLNEVHGCCGWFFCCGRPLSLTRGCPSQGKHDGIRKTQVENETILFQLNPIQPVISKCDLLIFIVLLHLIRFPQEISKRILAHLGKWRGKKSQSFYCSQNFGWQQKFWAKDSHKPSWKPLSISLYLSMYIFCTYILYIFQNMWCSLYIWYMGIFGGT